MSVRSAVILAAAVALQAGLSLHAMCGQSATFDEGAHLPAGYTHLRLGDHRLNPEQPPLVKLLAALPLVAARPVLRTDDRAWLEARQWEFGRRFLYRWNDGRRLLFLGRLPMVALASALVAAVFFEARRRFGLPAAAAAAFLTALAPDVLAHGTLVATDLAFALFYFTAIVAFVRLADVVEAGRAVKVRRLLLAALAFGAAFATKFSAPILALAVLLLALVWSSTGGRMVVGRRVRLAAASLVALGLAAWLVVWAAYGFRRPLSPDAAVRAEARAALEAPGASRPLRVAVALADAGVVPEDYVRGLRFVMTHSEARRTFLMGRLSDQGFPHYFLMTFLLKTPLPLVVLTLVAVARVGRLPRRDALVIWLPVLVYVAATATRGLQIGHRHLLPVYPFLFVAAGEAAARLVASRRLPAMCLVALLGSWYASATLRLHPHHLAFFNELAGGPANGWRQLVDSNLDWGQDLGRLAEWWKAAGSPRLKLSYFGSADPAYYGIEAEMLPGYSAPHATRITREIVPGDLLAISATNLQGVYLDGDDRALMDRIRALTPVDRVGYSILVYRADFAWPEVRMARVAGRDAR